MTPRLSRMAFTFLLASSVILVGCGGGDDGDGLGSDSLAVDTMDVMDGAGMEQAVAQVSPTEGNSARGTITFTSENGAVRVQGQLSGLRPGPHGIHVHENGDCSALDASSAGDHFNPTGQPHGSPQSAQRHVGDLGNVEAGADSTASISLSDGLITLSGPNSVVGKAVVVHADPDDLTSQPSGNSGSRVACGVIQMDASSGALEDTTATPIM
ncbi:MAG: superoxide dismutase family protein [Rhodothermales bacterium]